MRQPRPVPRDGARGGRRRSVRGGRGFRDQFPEIATSGYAARDYTAFTAEQREPGKALLLARRFTLAAARPMPDCAAGLLTHAGITTRELDLLGLPDERDPHAIAAALQARLDAAIDLVAADWRAGGTQPLSLAPLHVAGADGEEGGGLLSTGPPIPSVPAPTPHGNRREPHRAGSIHARCRSGCVRSSATGNSKAASELARWRHPDTDDRRGGLRCACRPLSTSATAVASMPAIAATLSSGSPIPRCTTSHRPPKSRCSSSATSTPPQRN